MSKMDDLLQKLQQDNLPQDEIGVILAEVTKASSLKLYTQLVAAVNDEDRQLLDESGDNEEENDRTFSALYEKYYHQTADEAVAELQEQFAAEFLNRYTTEPAQAQM